MSSLLFFPILGYVCGSIPFGVLFSRLFKLGDIRSIGSGNTGATNVLRTGNYKAAVLTLLCDFLKGGLPVWVYASDSFFQHTWYADVVVAIAPVLGHIFPVWSKFKGGKGVATTAGVYCALSPLAFAVGVTVWGGVFAKTRISSLAALISLCGVMPLFLWVFAGGRSALFAFSVIVAVVVLITHASNLKRLLSGNEMKISSSQKK
ncbi:MAG: glycerol-3-phosphate 1-O-acyltransferase PlsY [Holosporales bacterium]|jgi:glycerol-3-phosphate acyltransferase PlsY|nr:glycerol-3-phosphate 1-O-acyltransferase PlsY [Holosporales bacterium]